MSDPIVLVVDPDGVSRRFVELALRAGPLKGPPTAVESARDATSALEVMHTTRIDLVVSETDLPDMSGMAFYRRLQQEGRLRGIPFVFMSSDTRATAKVVALRSGADDFITKPCDAAELSARLEGIIDRRRRQRSAQTQRTYTLAGDFSTLPFPDLVSILELSRRTGSLTVTTRGGAGEVFFVDGRVIHAAFGNLAGTDAFYALMAEEDGHFEFDVRAADSCAHVTIDDTVTALVMEGARRLDDLRLVARPSSRAIALGRPSWPVRPSLPAPSLPPEPALRGAPSIGAQLELGISDGFGLGELRLYTRDELARWTRSAGGRDRFHVHLLADLAAGASALLAIAAQPTERWLLAALTPEEKALGLAFFLRHERLVDVVLLDVRDAGNFERSLGRAPALLIVAAPEGDYLAIGTKGTVKLEGLLRTVPPAAVLGVGNASLDQKLRTLLASHDPPPPLKCHRGTLGDSTCDLRALLVDGIGLWASSASAPLAVSAPPPATAGGRRS
jgi:CheY-like chemotaxis protein